MIKLLSSFFFVIAFIHQSHGQMPPPGYERAIKMKMEREKVSPLERDSMNLIDTVLVFDPGTFEEEVKIVISRMSIKDYCVNILGMPNPEILLDGNPHVIIDPKNYEDLMIRLNSSGKIDTIPK